MQKKKGGKSSIVRDLMAAGLTARKAVMAVNAVFDHMTLAAWWGEPVEIPGGLIQSTIRQGTPRRKLQNFRNIQTGRIDYSDVDYPGRRRVLKFTPDVELDLEPLPAPPLPETPEQEAVRRLAAELLGRPADKAIMAVLQEAVDAHPSKPGSLLRRLQEFKDRGWTFDDVYSLARQISFQCWL